MTVFHWLGIDLSGLLGAAGIAGVAIGFAAQTSVSNVISGLFVMTERAFKLGDFIQVDGISGTVESITLLSVRLQTPESQMVRIPNETIIKANMINFTYFPLRRFTMTVGVAYGTDLRKLKDVLLDIASKNAFSVTDPVPVVIFDSFADSSISILFGVWGKTAEFPDLKNSLMVEVAERFAAEGISIPFPQITVRSDRDFPED
jgi:small-conductance mechanosensitive channel